MLSKTDFDPEYAETVLLRLALVAFVRQREEGPGELKGPCGNYKTWCVFLNIRGSWGCAGIMGALDELERVYRLERENKST